MKKIKNTLLILILVLTITFLIPQICFADSDFSYGKIDTEEYNVTIKTTGTTKLRTMTADILATIRNIGMISTVVVISLIGIRYMLASIEEKAKYKENIQLLLIGCALILLATTIPSAIYDMIN